MRALYPFAAVLLFASQISYAQTAPVLTVSPTSLNFTFAQGAPLPPHQTISITSVPSPATFSLTVPTTPGSDWLDVTPLSGATPNTLTAQVNPFDASLAPGIYSTTITINQALKIPATLTVTTALTPSPATLSFTAQQGPAGSPTPAPQAQTLNVVSGGPIPVSASASSSGNWLAISPISATTPAAFTASVNPVGLGTGTFTGNITLSSPATPTVTVSVTLTVLPPVMFNVSPTTLYFVSTSALPQPPSQTVSVFSNITSPVFATAATASGNPWLSVTQSSTQTPLTLTVSVMSGLTGQTHSGTITLSTTNGGPAVATIPVNYIVNATQPATLQSSPDTLSFTSAQGGLPIQQALAISNAGGGALSYTAQVTAQSGGNWLTVQTPGGTVTAGSPGSVLFTVTPGSLAPGTYNGTITATSGTQTATALIVLSVNAQGPTLLLSQTGLAFTAAAQGPNPPTQTVSVANTGSGSLSWNVAAATLSGGNWLSATPTGGTTPAAPATPPTLAISVNSQSLAAGTYYGSVKVNTQVISVQTTVLPTGQQPSPSLSTNGLVFTAAAGGTNPAAQPVVIYDPLGYSSTVSTDDGGNWLSATPAAATIGVQTALTSLTPGIRHGTIRLGFADGSTQTISVLSVTAPSGTAPQSISNAFSPAASGCPSVLVPQMTTLSSNFAVNASQSVPLSVTVVDDCGHVLPNSSSSSVVASFYDATKPPGPSAKLQADLRLTPQGNGVWSGTLTPQAATAQMEIIVVALGINGTIPIAGQSTLIGAVHAAGSGSPGLPIGIFNAASYQPGNTIALGSFVSIFGTNLADGSGAPGTQPLPTSFEGTQVFLGGVALPLQYAGPNQINALIPANVAVDSQQPLVVQRDMTQAAPTSVTIADSQPGIYTANQQGTGQGAVLTSDNSLDAPTGAFSGSHPATRGDYIEIFCTGLGAVTNPPAAGGVVPSSPLSYTVGTVTAAIGGVSAPVLFSGLAPGYIGLYQVNVTVPQSAPTGGAVPLVLTVGSAVSNTATIAVQ